MRAITTLAKLLILNRDLEGFVASIGLLATLLGERWQDVHPHGEDGDFGVRMASLTTLDDLPPVVLPLQYVPLVQHKRHGPIAYRHQMIATGEVGARDGELALDVAAVERALMEVESPTSCQGARTDGRTSRAALTRIRAVCIEQVGYAEALPLEKLPGLVEEALAFLDGVLVKRDPSLVPSPEAPSEGKQAAAESAPRPAIVTRPLSGRIINFSPNARPRRSRRRPPISVETSRRARLCCSSARPSSSSGSLSWN